MHGLRCKCLILFLLALATPAFSLEWYQSYEKGQAAIKKGDCSSGKAMMLEALRKNPKAELKSHPYGTFVLEYIPHFYLFQCAVMEGDFVAAEDYRKQAEAAGVFASSKAAEFRQLKTKLPQQQTLKPVVPEVVVEPKPKVTNPPPSDTLPPSQQQSPEANKQTQAQQALREARDALASGDTKRARIAAYRANALVSNLPEARRLLQDIDRAERAQQETLERREKIDQATRALKSGDLVAAVSHAAELRIKYPDDPQVQALSDEIQRRMEKQDENAQAANERKLVERQVVLAYYKGQYNAVMELAQQGLAKNPDSWRLHFYLGCSYASLAMLEEDSERNLKLAQASFARAKGIGSSAGLPPYISPKILKIYNNS